MKIEDNDVSKTKLQNSHSKFSLEEAKQEFDGRLERFRCGMKELDKRKTEVHNRPKQSAAG